MINCPNKSWPPYKDVVAKHGEEFANDAFRFNGYKMFNSVEEAENLVNQKKQLDKKLTADIKKDLLDVLKFQRDQYSKRSSAASKAYVQDIDGVIKELQDNNDLVGLLKMLEISNDKSNSVFKRITELQNTYPNFDNLSQDQVAAIAETLQEIRRFMSTYDILDDIQQVLSPEHPAMQLISNLRGNYKQIVRMYKGMHEEVLASWLSSQVERVNKTLADQDKAQYFLTKTRIKELLNTATSDIRITEKMLGAQANSKDPLTGLIAARIKEEAFIVHNENVDVHDRLVGLYRATSGSNNPEEFNKRYLRNAKSFEFIPDRNAKGEIVYDEDDKPVGHWGYVNRKAFITEFDHDAYDSDLREFENTLPPGTSEAGIKRRLQALRNWRKANTQLRTDPQGLIDRKKQMLNPLEFDRWMADNTLRLEVRYYSDGSSNLDYHDPDTVHSVSKDGKTFVIYKDVSDFFMPADKYKNKQYAALKNDPYYMELLKTYTEANERVHEAKRLKYGIIPQKRKRGYDKYLVGNGESVWTNIKDDFGHAINVEEYDTAYGIQTPDKKELRHIPIYFTNMLDEKELSTDLLESTLDYFQMANNYYSMSKIEPFIEMVYDAVEGNDIVNISARNVQMLTADGRVKKDRLSGRPLKGRTENVNEALVEFLDKVVYGEYEIPEIVSVGDKQISLNKVAKAPLKMTALNGLAFNINSFFNNTLMGNFTMAIEALANKNFGFKEFISAEGTYMQAVPALMNDVAQGHPTSKLGKLMVRYDAIQGEFTDDYGNNLSGNAAKRMFTSNTLFFLTKGGEHQIQGTGFIAMMKKQKVQLKNGTTISLWDAYDENGALRSDAIWSKEDQFHFMQKLHSLNKEMHGIYNKYDSPTLQRRWYGKLALIFRKWVYSGLMRRWKGEYHNMESGEVEHGYYRLFFSKLYKDMKKGNFEMLFGGKNLSPREREARAKALGEITTIVAMMFVFAAVKGDDDDEPNSWVQNQAILQSRRLAGDFMFFTMMNPAEMLRIVQNPTVALSQTMKVSKLITQLFNPLEKYQRKTGFYEKGDYKIEKRFADLVPVYGQLIRALTPEEQIKEYNRAGGILGQ